MQLKFNDYCKNRNFGRMLLFWNISHINLKYLPTGDSYILHHSLKLKQKNYLRGVSKIPLRVFTEGRVIIIKLPLNSKLCTTYIRVILKNIILCHMAKKLQACQFLKKHFPKNLNFEFLVSKTLRTDLKQKLHS